jgi:transcriptional regulator with XRE-family HTH domain
MIQVPPSYHSKMTIEGIFANKLRAERERQGIETAEELARRADIDPEMFAQMEAGELLPTPQEARRLAEALGVKTTKLFTLGILGAIGLKEGGTYEAVQNQKDFYRGMREPTRLLMTREEMTWLERAAEPDGEYDVFLNMSCGTQMYPNLMLDMIAVFRTLGVNFLAAAGPDFCCGGYLRINHTTEAGVKMAEKNIMQVTGRKVKTHVSQCTQCINNYTATSRRRVAEGGEATPVREMQTVDFVAERLQELGDDVPWVRSVERKVLVHGHPNIESPITTKTVHDTARLLRLVPGVEVLGIMEPTFMNDFCYTGDLPGYPTTPNEMQARRHDIAAIARSYGADTVSPQHQDCTRLWAPFASVDMAVRNPISIVAGALGCDHPDRVQAAYMLGDPDEVVEQTRPVWTSWGLTEDKAREIAHREYKPANAAKVAGCACGRGGCGNEILDIEVLKGVDWKSAMQTAARDR